MSEVDERMPGPDAGAGLLLQFLAWVAARPRAYADTMEAWRTSCPRISVWESRPKYVISSRSSV